MSREEFDQEVLRALLWASRTLYAARVDRDGVVRDANPALEAAAGGALAGERFDAVVAAPQRPALATHLASAPADAWARLTIGFWQGGSTAAEDRLVHVRAMADGEVLVVAEPHGDERDRLVEQVLRLNDDLIASQRDLGRRQREVTRAQAGAEEAGQRLRRLEAITLAGFTATSLDVALERMLVLAREALGGERAAVLLSDDDDRRRLRVRAALGMEGLVGDYAHMGTGVSGLIASAGRGMVFDDISLVDGLASEHRRFSGSLAGVPLRLDGEVIGTLHVSTSEIGRFGEDDLRLLEAVGDRAALAIGHAQLRERERDLAETLQRSLLPRVLPAAAGVRLAARYLPRGAEGPVGGDFYDAVALPGDRVGLAIGDVAGKGLAAAAAMGQVRAALHAYALEDPDPARVLARLDGFVGAMDITATALFMTIDADGELAIASAGHPPAVLTDAAGTRLVTGVLTPPLGCGAPAAEAAERLRLGHGARLLLYTDGLVERRDERLDRSLEALRTVVASSPHALDVLCDRVLEALAPDGGVWPDDVALLAVARG
ncbi:MAG TPA: GAF domain-containing SpoIIE family protein phosphatase [Baekduia sp.]|uniref:PP2C family protein-serine/threonine phosphatase n=1 Tax=Baekduia sp. TaxID=2600305 RepID=UPI002D7683D8|nr:GAF domain-containing SpoIIE family protein phosphatase [Baekduia sp.]HET6506894.1 GAF domain-containing SpoIIE family protein phosphatase [Baekduia sp.]